MIIGRKEAKLAKNLDINSIKIVAHDVCCGCEACYSICPFHSIHMKEDEEGFLYPVVDEACQCCGLCITVCPVLKMEKII